MSSSIASLNEPSHLDFSSPPQFHSSSTSSLWSLSTTETTTFQPHSTSVIPPRILGTNYAHQKMVLNNSTDEGVVVSSDEATVELVNYIAHGILANFIVGVGIVGNVLNLIVLTRPKLKGVMYVYLLGLAVSNLCVLIMAIPALMDIAGNMNTSASYSAAFFQAHFEITLLNSFMAASVYIIICMTVNRYISIYKPTQFQRIHTFKNAYIAILFSFLGGALLHIPLAFETNVTEECNTAQDSTTPPTFISNNLTISSSSSSVCTYSLVRNTAIAGHPLYRVYLWMSEILLRLGPIITLTILNVLIIVKFHQIARKREVLKGGATGARGSTAGLISGGQGEPRMGAMGPMSTTRISSHATTTTSSGYQSSCGPQSSFAPPSVVLPGLTSITEAEAAAPSSTVTTHNGKLSVPNIMEERSSSLVRFPSADHISNAGQTPSPVLLARHTATPSPLPHSPFHRTTPTRHSTKRRGLHSPEERMLVVVLIAIVILFVVCTTPAAFLSVLVTPELKRQVWFSIFRACANNLELLCFACNFFVYCLCSADIRRAFVDVLFENPVVQYVRRTSATFKPGNGGGLELATIHDVPPVQV